MVACDKEYDRKHDELMEFVSVIMKVHEDDYDHTFDQQDTDCLQSLEATRPSQSTSRKAPMVSTHGFNRHTYG